MDSKEFDFFKFATMLIQMVTALAWCSIAFFLSRMAQTLHKLASDEEQTTVTIKPLTISQPKDEPESRQVPSTSLQRLQQLQYRQQKYPDLDRRNFVHQMCDESEV